MTETKIPACDVRVGDRILVGTDTVVVMYVSLVRGTSVLIRYRHEGLHMRMLGEKDMTVGKYAPITKIS